MPYIDTSSLDEFVTQQRTDYLTQHQIYNGLDCCITFEIFERLSEELRKQNESFASDLYSFERGMQGLALDMMQRGFLTDAQERERVTRHYSNVKLRVEAALNRFASAVWGMPLNPNSPKQLREFFYGAMELPEQFSMFRGRRVVSCNRECLEKLLAYYYTRPIINCILEARDAQKKISVLTAGISPLGRYHSTFSPASTETGRWSSSKDAFGEGGNAQNITPELRRVFIADAGRKLVHFDQEQAESRVVGLLLKGLGDERYIKACTDGDLHTTVARMVWPDKVSDRVSAEKPYYRHFSYRDMSKRGGHLSNYLGKPKTMARHLKLPLDICEEFQHKYYRNFGLPRFHQYIAQELQLNQKLLTPLGMCRHFFGNPYDEETIKEATAFIPQSTVGQLTAYIAYKTWIEFPSLQPLTNDHDGFTWQIIESKEKEAFEYLSHFNKIPLQFKEATINIPLEFSSGWNWGRESPSNPLGLKKWKGEDTRGRERLA